MQWKIPNIQPQKFLVVLVHFCPLASEGHKPQVTTCSLPGSNRNEFVLEFALFIWFFFFFKYLSWFGRRVRERVIYVSQVGSELRKPERSHLKNQTKALNNHCATGSKAYGPTLCLCQKFLQCALHPHGKDFSYLLPLLGNTEPLPGLNHPAAYTEKGQLGLSCSLPRGRGGYF